MYRTAPNQPVNPRSFRVLLLGLLLALTAVAPFLGADEAARTGKTVFPAQVLIIRHAEKPPETDNSVHLSKLGEQRAEALYKLFQPSATKPTAFPRPDFIFATHNTTKSHRPLETVTPLARKLGLPINSLYRNRLEGDVREESKNRTITDLSKELFSNEKYQGKTILICWHHGKIPELAKQLRAKDYPKEWEGKVFDRVWQISYDKKGQTNFASLPERLLSGDAEK